MDTVIVIPARYGSQRFPGKCLALLGGKPVIQWVYEKAVCVLGKEAVWVATDHPEIEQVIARLGGNVVRTTEKGFLSGTQRVAWVVEHHLPQIKWICNVQGDEPFLDPKAVKKLLNGLKNRPQGIWTLACPLERGQKNLSQVVKVVCDRYQRALYFSRAAIPFQGQEGLRHIGIYAMERERLFQWIQAPPCELEKWEQLEQLRALYEGMPIFVETVPYFGIAIDTLEDLQQAKRILKHEKT